jgi:DNA-directed RNA polymerase subunit beta'
VVFREENDKILDMKVVDGVWRAQPNFKPGHDRFEYVSLRDENSSLKRRDLNSGDRP